jgi:hypothetical protein
MIKKLRNQPYAPKWEEREKKFTEREREREREESKVSTL